jgi:hypothetical protein
MANTKDPAKQWVDETVPGIATRVSTLETKTAGLPATSTIVTDIAGVVTFPSLPTADPHVVGQVWANSGVLTVSAG